MAQKITDASWIFLDTETTGLKPEEGARVIELGWCKINNMMIGDSADYLIDPGVEIPPEITKLNNITNGMVHGKPNFKRIAAKFLHDFKEATFVAAYNKDFDKMMLESEFKNLGMNLPEKIWLDPLSWSRAFIGGDMADHKLATLANRFKVSLFNAHRADADAYVAAKIMIEFFKWGVDEANFPDDVDALKELERGWRRSFIKTASANKRMPHTGVPGAYAQNVYDNFNRDRLFKLSKLGRWGR